MEIEIFIEGRTITITSDSNIEIIANRGTASSLPNIDISKYRYFEIRDLAWQVLIDCNVKELPVMTTKIAEHYGIAMVSFRNNEKFLKQIKAFARHSISKDAFCGKIKDELFICYNNSVPRTRKRYNIAHEIGHLLLRHNPQVRIGELEREAEMFAARLLMPMCVLKECGAFSSERISELCLTSSAAATKRAARLKMLMHRQKFYTSPLEIAVVKQFEEYVKKIKYIGS